jgi:spore germination protein KA
MFSLLFKKLKFLQSLISKPEAPSSPREDPLTGNLVKDLAAFRKQVGDSPDIVVREFNISHNISAAVIFIDGLVLDPLVNQHIMHPLTQLNEHDVVYKKGRDLFDSLKNKLLPVGSIREESSLTKTIERVFTGATAILIDGSKKAILTYIPGWERRSISEPDSEIVVKGPREGFVETLRTNTALLRRKIGHPGLTFETLVIGQRTRTEVTIAYLNGVANPKLVQEVKRRLERIKTDGILNAGYIEQYIEDAPFSPFMTVGYTERPDVAAARILEGRVAILTEGTPVVNTVPFLFVESFQSPDDYTFRPYFTTLTRWFRYIAFAGSVLSPGMFVALTTFHQELLPTPLLISMAAAMEGTPLPAVGEALVMGLIFEILREAGIRLPKAVGQAVSIVGALVIGEAAVQAGFIGAPVVIVVAFTAISSFAVPKQFDVGALLRVVITILAGLFGLYGILIFLIITFTHLVSLRSFGIPYLSPISPLMPKDLKDVLVRAPAWAMVTRPESLDISDPVRQEFDLMPGPENDKKNQKN